MKITGGFPKADFSKTVCSVGRHIAKEHSIGLSGSGQERKELSLILLLPN